ncbi:uncharacterized protein PHACADRAFT_259540 [Phanerochaete carnosa HHB-10118-sp]|uniref:Uncharacterized protein n=1 Tax=Phanerochaete carnosa (strain HHB-10118-sp) TaxID=650164 RepID=K5UTM4_PHACS|nr:uncharacterized protein PHACADRAFT_259540 [Phanerochaete carnosa HHB-10118-sp]EKM53286.1 hypothetical protein PHACADRAFT_259540 [Phanerochaete carnosa HHB-10118-sp]
MGLSPKSALSLLSLLIVGCMAVKQVGSDQSSTNKIDHHKSQFSHMCRASCRPTVVPATSRIPADGFSQSENKWTARGVQAPAMFRPECSSVSTLA